MDKYIINFLLVLILLNSCNNDEGVDTETITSEPESIELLLEDVLFLDYMTLLNTPVISSREDIQKAIDILLLKERFEDLNDEKKLILANGLGFVDFNGLIDYITTVKEIEDKLEKKYQLSSVSWDILSPIYEQKIKDVVLQNYIVLKQKGNSDLPASECFDEDHTDLETLECMERHFQKIKDIHRRYRKRAEKLTDCSHPNFPSFGDGCPPIPEIRTELSLRIVAVTSDTMCCIAESCEGVDYSETQLSEWCDPPFLGF